MVFVCVAGHPNDHHKKASRILASAHRRVLLSYVQRKDLSKMDDKAADFAMNLAALVRAVGLEPTVS